MVEHPTTAYEAGKRQTTLILRLVRVAFFALILTVALVTVLQEADRPGSGQPVMELFPWWSPIMVAAGLFAVVLIIDLLTPNKKISTITAVFVGLVGGMLATFAIGFVIDLIVASYLTQQELEKVGTAIGLFKVLIGIALSYLGIAIVLQTKDDFRLLIPYVEFSKELRGPQPLLLDTSTLIDARITEVAATGFIQAPIAIPRFVIGELQLLADSRDKLKRARGRRGLDMIARLQRTPGIEVRIDNTLVPGTKVDAMLIELARRMPATVVTTDTGLARVASIQGVSYLNIHEIAAALRPNLLPGESLEIRLIRKGEQAGQAVGYLEDGTMVVVENAEDAIDSQVEVQVSSTLQTSAGRLIFASLPDHDGFAPEDHEDQPDDLGDFEQPQLTLPHETTPGTPPETQSDAADEPAPEQPKPADTSSADESPTMPARPPVRRSSRQNPRRA